MLKNDWTESWEREDTPDPLGMPLQGMVTADAMSRVHRYGEQAQAVAFNPVGQVVGMMNEERSCRDVQCHGFEEASRQSGNARTRV